MGSGRNHTPSLLAIDGDEDRMYEPTTYMAPSIIGDSP